MIRHSLAVACLAAVSLSSQCYAFSASGPSPQTVFGYASTVACDLSLAANVASAVEQAVNAGGRPVTRTNQVQGVSSALCASLGGHAK